MNKLVNIIALLILPLGIFAQQQQTIKLNSNQIEEMFISQNLELMAEKMNVDIADAQILQAKLWDNPEFSISSVNLWSTKSQREEQDMHSFPKNTQFSIELSQMIQTANKRGKLKRKETTAKGIALAQFEDVLRGLKVELKKSVSELIFLQSYNKVLINQEEYLSRLTSTYKKQQELGNISKAELIRLQSASLELESEINDTQKELNEQYKNLKVLLNIDPTSTIEVEDLDYTTVNPDNIVLSNLLETAIDLRADVKKMQLETQYQERSLAYEKSLRVPDITLSANYDKYGGIWKDFVGFGVSFDIPVFDRNQGNIKAARIERDQSAYLAQQQKNVAQHEIVEAFSNYTQAFTFYQKIKNNDLLSQLDGMLETYSNNLLKRNISMLEYIDFMDTYKENKQTVLSAQKNIHTSFDELQYVSGQDIK